MAASDNKRKVIRVVFADAKDDKGMVQCIVPEGTEVLRADKRFRVAITNDTWPVLFPEEMLDDPNAWDESED